MHEERHYMNKKVIGGIAAVAIAAGAAYGVGVGRTRGAPARRPVPKAGQSLK